MGQLQEFFQNHEWTQGTYARDKNGNMMASCNPNANSFCMLGGVFYLTPDDYAQRMILERKVGDAVTLELEQKQIELPWDKTAIPYFNDKVLKSKTEMMAFLEKYQL